MALMTVGRAAFAYEGLVGATGEPMAEAEGRIDRSGDDAAKLAAAKEELKKAKDELAKVKADVANARSNLLTSLTPWIPGDFVVSYGVLLTAWSSVQSSFPWLLVSAGGAALIFVLLGNFAETGFRGVTRRQWGSLMLRTVVGFGVALLAAAAIPRSGWYDFGWFARNETGVVLTATGVVLVPVVLILKGLSKATDVKLVA